MKNGNSSTEIMSRILTNNGKLFSCHPMSTNSCRWNSSPYILIQLGLKTYSIENFYLMHNDESYLTIDASNEILGTKLVTVF